MAVGMSQTPHLSRLNKNHQYLCGFRFSLERMDLAVKNPINAVPTQLDTLN